MELSIQVPKFQELVHLSGLGNYHQDLLMLKLDQDIISGCGMMARSTPNSSNGGGAL
jgi:hypothetical protein